MIHQPQRYFPWYHLPQRFLPRTRSEARVSESCSIRVRVRQWHLLPVWAEESPSPSPASPHNTALGSLPVAFQPALRQSVTPCSALSANRHHTYRYSFLRRTIKIAQAAHCDCVLSCFSRVRLFVTLWTVARQAPLSMGFSRQEYWSGLHALLQGIFLPRDRTCVSSISCFAGGFFTTEPPGKPEVAHHLSLNPVAQRMPNT